MARDGGAWCDHSGGHFALGGGSGGYNSGYVTVEENQVITITVGKGGTVDGTSEHNEYSGASAGNSGFVLIAYGGDI